MTRTPRPSYRSRPLPKGWGRLRARVLRRDHHLCQLTYPGCTTHATEVDHIIPAAQDGTDDATNLQAVCTNCHRTKTATDNPMTQTRRRPSTSHPGELT